MKKNITILFTLLTVTFGFAQNNKFESFMASKKLSSNYKNVKANDTEDYYQQYYWMKKVEELNAYPHLSKMKPVVLYEFVKDITPQQPTKKLDARGKSFRAEAEKSLNQYFSKKDFANPTATFNLNTYVDPEANKYKTTILADRVKELVTKELYTATYNDTEKGEQKVKYLWNEDPEKFKLVFVDIIPSDKDKAFYSQIKNFAPEYKFTTFVPEVRKGNKKEKKDLEYFYIKPVETGGTAIEYRTKDFKKFDLILYKNPGDKWRSVNEHRVDE